MAIVRNKFVLARSNPEGVIGSTRGEQSISNAKAAAGIDPSGIADTSQEQDRLTVPVENDDPLRRRIVHPGRNGVLSRAMRAIAHTIRPRTLSSEEAAEIAEEKARKQLEDTLRRDAETAIRWMTSCLDRLGICYVRRDAEGRIKRIQHVHFDEVRMEPDAIHVHVDTHRLPWGVDMQQLRDQSVIDNLSISVGRAITCLWTPESGIWYTIERASGRAGIPNHVQIAEMWERMPASADSLTIAVGKSHNARLVYEDLSRMPHALVAGATLSGKTTFLHSIICTLIRRNTPDRMRLVLVDLKGGLAFRKYIGIPHLLTDHDFCPNGVITERENVMSMLQWLIVEGEKRMAILSSANCESIGQYNANRKKNRMPYLVVVIDEWADMMYSSDRREAEAKLVNVVQRMRAVGFHVILSTQIPKSEVITGLIKGNLPARFAFSVPNLHASLAILDNRSAVGLQPAGRLVMQFLKEQQVQAPWISQELIEATVRGAITGDFGVITRGHDVTPDEVREWAIRENNGWLTQRTVYPAFRERGITVAELNEWIDSWEGKTFLIGNSVYVVTPPAGNRGRRLVVADPGTDYQPEAQLPRPACQYCGTGYTNDETTCLACGAPR